MGGVFYAPLRRTNWLPGSLLASVLVVGSWSWLIHSGSIGTIWPMFGVANQLLAAIALSVGTTLLIREGKQRYAPITAIPMAFMFSTTLTASWKLFHRFWGLAAAHPEMALTYRLDACLVGLMAVLAIVVLLDAIRQVPALQTAQ
jgi:carbon starvation protein